MEDELLAGVPCSSRAVESVIRVSTAGGLYGFCAGPRNARKLGIMKIYLFLFIYLRFLKNLHLADELKLPGLSGVSQASYVAKSIGKIGFQCGIVSGIFTLTNCGLQRYRGKSDWVNALVGGAVAGAAVALRTRNCSHVVTTAGLVSIFSVLANSTRTDLKQQH
ncbi:outer envelope pore protein 16-4, chloroplastic isoform X1 [Brassica napus]|uniref:outer envelope pore protein 16-4, chloroplastic isoform X1 n=1 Tax=Brassica napus TaxID=3708 RepID=UPI00207AB978|nr:outer envelope pore protein 16-4, chloroplastic isoform X1 [Brassica napus]